MIFAVAFFFFVTSVFLFIRYRDQQMLTEMWYRRWEKTQNELTITSQKFYSLEFRYEALKKATGVEAAEGEALNEFL